MIFRLKCAGTSSNVKVLTYEKYLQNNTHWDKELYKYV